MKQKSDLEYLAEACYKNNAMFSKDRGLFRECGIKEGAYKYCKYFLGKRTFITDNGVRTFKICGYKKNAR